MAASKAYIGVGGSPDHTSLFDFDATSTDTNMVNIGTTMFKDPETDAEAGYIAITINGTEYQIPFYAAS